MVFLYKTKQLGTPVLAPVIEVIHLNSVKSFEKRATPRQIK